MIYKEGDFHDTVMPDCTKTWSYANYMKDREDIEYASLYAPGKSLDDLADEKTKERLAMVQRGIKAVLKSCTVAGLDISRACLYDFVPRHHLINLAVIKNTICEEVFNNCPKPKSYEQLLKITKIIADIKTHPVEIDLSKITRLTVQDKNIYNLLSKSAPTIDYDPNKTITGRLATRKNTFPVMTLARKYRNVLVPTHNWFFEMDFNACELRTALALLGYTQPEEDLHAWNLTNVFTRAKDRDNAKKRIFAWLYNPKSTDTKVSKIYDRKKLKELYYDGKRVLTPYGREIECDEDHAVSYLIQSTAADVVFEQMYKLWKHLDGKKSFIKFCNHDSIMIDLHSDEEKEFHDMKRVFASTRFGKFRTTCFGGTDWSKMKKLRII